MKTLNQLAKKYDVEIEKAKELLSKKGVDVSNVDAPLDFESELLAEEILGVQQRFAQIEKGLQPGKQIETRVYPTYETKKDGLKGCSTFAWIFVGAVFLLNVLFFSSLYKKAKNDEIKNKPESSMSEISDNGSDGLSELPDESSDISSESQDDSGIKTVNFTWYDEYHSKQWQYSADFPDEIYMQYEEMHANQGGNVDYSLLINDENSAQYIGDIVSEFSLAFEKETDSRQIVIQMLITFVQSIDYMNENDENRKVKYPFETLYDESGDEQDKSVLLVSLLKSFGVDAVLLKFDDHMAVGISDENGIYEGLSFEMDGKEYFYVEVVAGSWDIGTAPDEYKEKMPEIIVFISDSE